MKRKSLLAMLLIALMNMMTISAQTNETLEDWYNKAVYLENDRNGTEAVKWYRKAAEHGHAKAQYALGRCYFKGIGVSHNYTLAAMWYRKAAEQGHIKAQIALAASYLSGQGVSKDEVKAAKWCRKAAENGSILAKDALETLEKNK